MGHRKGQHIRRWKQGRRMANETGGVLLEDPLIALPTLSTLLTEHALGRA